MTVLTVDEVKLNALLNVFVVNSAITCVLGDIL